MNKRSPKKKAAAKKKPAKAAPAVHETVDEAGNVAVVNNPLTSPSLQDQIPRSAPSTASSNMAGDPIQTESEVLAAFIPASPHAEYPNLAAAFADEKPESYGDKFRVKAEERKILNTPIDKPTQTVLNSEIEAGDMDENDMPLPTRALLGNLKRGLMQSLKSIERLFAVHDRREQHRRQVYEQEQLKKQATPEQE